MKQNVLIDTRDLSREQWLEYRRMGIGGSDAAAILGMNAYRSPLMVYADKTGQTTDDFDNEAMRIGRDLEDYVAKRFTEQTGKKVRRLNAMLQHEMHPFMLANVDRIVVGENAGLECKTTSIFNRTDFESGAVPPSYYWQCQHYMAVTGYPLWYLAVLVMGKSFHAIEIPRNEAHIEKLIEAEAEFWDRVQLKDPPYPTGLAGESEVLQAIYPQAEGDIEIDNPALIEEYFKLKTEEKAIKASIERCKNELIQAMQGNTYAHAGNYKLSYTKRISSRIDTDRIKKEIPDIYTAYSRQSTSYYFNAKEQSNESI